MRGISERKACDLVSLQRSTYRYRRSQDNGDGVLRERIKELAEGNRRYGYRRIQVLLEREGFHLNHKKIYRIYREEGLTIRQRRRKKLLVQRTPLADSERPNQIWGLDFIFDSTEIGRNLKTLVVIDEFSRYLIAADMASSIDSSRVTRMLEYAIAMYGRPECLRSDNGPEFTSRTMMLWCMEKGIEQSLINPGKPIENSIVESFNGKFRDEFLNENLFLSVRDARGKLADWKEHYNAKRPHSSLGNRTPEEFWLDYEDGLTKQVV